MKKSPLVLSIISLILTLLAGVLFVLLPKMAFETLQFAPTWYNGTVLLSSKEWVTRFFVSLPSSLINTFTLKGPYMVYGILLIVLTCGWALFWLWHFVRLCAKRRPDSLIFNLFWLLFGACNLCVFYSYIGYTSGNNFKEGLMFNANGISDGFGLIADAFKNNHPLAATELLLPFVLVCLSAYLFLIGMLVSLHDMRKNPGHSNKQQAKITQNQPTAPQNDAMNEAQQQEMNNVGKTDNAKESYVVQNFSYGMPMPAPYVSYSPRPEEKQGLTEDDVRRVVTEVLLQNQSKSQPVSTPSPVEEKPSTMTERPLTAKELRNIIQDELRDHDHPEDLMPLTDEQCRRLIRDELDDYYAGTKPEEEPATETAKPLPAEPAVSSEIAPAPTETENNEDYMTAEDLGKMIKEEVANALREAKVVEPEEKEQPVPSLSEDDIRKVVSEELAKQPAPTIPEDNGLKAEDVRSIVKEELSELKDAKAVQDQEIAAAKEQTEKLQYNLKASDVRNQSMIDALRSQQLTMEQIRTVISEELDKKLAEKPAPAPVAPAETKPKPVVVEPAPTIVAAPAPIVVAEPAPNPVQTPASESEAAPEPEVEVALTPDPAVASVKVRAPRVPFATRVLAGDKELQANYNELKAEALSYGLKSRLSVSGDTFRLHTKTYLKIIVAGKGLKLYFALNPDDYADSPIPVKNAGVKNLYKDIPLVFKVKSGLSVKRAKQLIADVCAKDGLEKATIVPMNYVAQLQSYKVAGSEDDSDEEDDED